MIKTRFAPSPTGELHIGGARTALFAYLFAKHNKGQFLLRIEDTDRERFVEGSIERIVESLEWLKINRDNKELMIQSNRLEIYKRAAFDLVKAGKAYICTCSKEKLAEDRQKQEKEGKPTRYERHCRDAGIGVSDFKDGDVIRMNMPKKGKIKFDDLIRGEIEFDLSLIDDQVLLKSDGYPTYHLASIVDDHEMGITHVIRAEEWLSSTPKHLILYQMFGWEPPLFAHLSMILGHDKKKLSKRHGATSVLAYRDEGYLPEALDNFMALLGWNPKDEREEFSMEELIAEFRIENINKSPAIFDLVKLNHINSHYLMKLSDGRLKLELKSFGLSDLTSGEISIIKRGGYNTLKEATQYIKSLRQMPDYKAETLIFKKSNHKLTLLALRAVTDKFVKITEWNSDNIQKALSYVVIEQNLTNGDVFWPVRVALSGADKSPSPVELAYALGQIESIQRINSAINKLG